MNLTLFGAIALVAFVSDASAQFGPPPGIANLFASPASNPGWAIGQESSKNAVNLAVNNAIAKANSTELPPELQEELQAALTQAELDLLECDAYLVAWNIWRFKICKFQALAKLRLKIEEIKLKAQQYSSTTTSTTQESTTFQSSSSTQSTTAAA